MSTEPQQQPGWREILGFSRREADTAQDTIGHDWVKAQIENNAVKPEDLDIEALTSDCYMIEKGASWTEWEACLLALLRSIPRADNQYQDLFARWLNDELSAVYGETQIFIEEAQPVNG